MPIHVRDLRSELSLLDGRRPVSAEDLERIVELVAARLSERERPDRADRRVPRSSIIPPLETRG